jgi:integrase
MNELVRLRTRPSRDGKTFVYRLEYVDTEGKRRRISLGHADRRKAESQMKQTERELRMGILGPGPMKLSEFLEDSLARTQGQVEASTLAEQLTAMKQLIEVIGDIDIQKVQYRHGEHFIQACLDRGNTPATAYKKLAGLKRLFQLAVLRGQLDNNPLRNLQRPKIAEQAVRIYEDEQCRRLLRAARELSQSDGMNWELLIAVGLCTGMRRGELLNTVWRDVDFEKQTIKVSPKQNIETTWQWHIKDAERRTLPLTDDVIRLLVEHQEEQPEGYVYVFVPPCRCDRIQELRCQNEWTTTRGRCPVNNFNRDFDRILERAGIDEGEFHDLRRTCLTRWFTNGLLEFDVMKLAGHSDFSTTHRFYLAVRRDLTDKARAATAAAMVNDFGTRLARAPVLDRRALTPNAGNG